MPTALPVHNEDRWIIALMESALLTLLINSKLEARWLPHSRQVKTLPCRAHRKSARHAASHQKLECTDVQASLSAEEARWHHLQMLCEDAPHATLAWTSGALPNDYAQKAQGLHCLGGHT